MDQSKPVNLSAFSIGIIFLMFSSLGIALLPFLSVKLDSSYVTNGINIYFEWRGHTAEEIESEVTSKVESIVSTVQGVKEITSISTRGTGSVYVQFDKNTNTYKIRHELVTILRHVFDKFPGGVSFPEINIQQPQNKLPKAILSYALCSKVLPCDILTKYAKEVIKPALSVQKGIEEVALSGGASLEYKLSYSPDRLRKLNIQVGDIINAIEKQFITAGLGKIELTSQSGLLGYFILRRDDKDSLNWRETPIKSINGRIIRLNEVVEIELVTEAEEAFLRVNGLPTVILDVFTIPQSNYFKLAPSIKNIIKDIRKDLPAGTYIIELHDASNELLHEVHQALLKTCVTLLGLLLFVFVIYRRVRYLLVITLSLIANLLIGITCFYLMKLEIHLYTIIGIMVSLGIIIDGSIVMIDHLSIQKNRKVFLALTGAHLTTIGSICVIFFLDEEHQAYLMDFTWAIIINLIISLPVGYFLIPALLRIIPLGDGEKNRSPSYKKTIVRLTFHYFLVIKYLYRFRRLVIIAAVLLFGFPTFLMPTKLQSDSWFAKKYNQIFNQTYYQKEVRPTLDKWAGGTLRLFFKRLEISEEYQSINEDDRLLIEIYLPAGASAIAVQDIVSDFERYLKDADGIREFRTKVPHRRSAQIEIYFDSLVHGTTFPLILKNQIETKAVNTGFAEFNITGIGQGFNNQLQKDKTDYTIILNGYNYGRLLSLANEIKSKIKANPRVSTVIIKSFPTNYQEDVIYEEYSAELKKKEQLLAHGITQADLANLAHQGANRPFRTWISEGNDYVPATLTAETGDPVEVWQFANSPLLVDSLLHLKLENLWELKKEKRGDLILRINQQYQLTVNYQYIGDYALGNDFLNQQVKEIQSGLPQGYSAKVSSSGFWTSNSDRLLWAVFYGVGIIFLICTILLGDFWQSIAVVAMIPISFVGIFLSPVFVSFNFDEGVYAAFIFLSGLSVNWALFILNDFNNLKQRSRRKVGMLIYKRAFRLKFTPIMLSAISCMIGLLPFVTNNSLEVFWYGFGVCSLGGILFSLIGTFLLLPLILPGLVPKK